MKKLFDESGIQHLIQSIRSASDATYASKSEFSTLKQDLHTISCDFERYVADGKFRLVSDANTAVEQGVVYAGADSTSNTPFPKYWMIVPFRYNSTYFVQLAFCVNTLLPTMYIRSNTASQWGPWACITCGVPVSVQGGALSADFLTLQKSGNIVTFDVSGRLPAGSYSPRDILWRVSPAPNSVAKFVVRVGEAVQTLVISTNGQVIFEDTFTVEESCRFVGMCSYVIVPDQM